MSQDSQQILRSQDLAPLIPDVYAAWRPLVVDALAYFLDGLSAERRGRLMFEQAALPAECDIRVRLVHVMHACPTLHKLGQVIARHKALDAGLRTQLQRLEMTEPRTPFAHVESIVRGELAGALGEYDIRIDPQPVAEASVAVVLPITWRPCPSAAGSETIRERGVLKVLRPGIREQLAEELDILARLADHLDERRSAYDLPAFDYRDTFDTVRELLENEVRFEEEQRNLAAAAERFAGHRDVVVPRLLPFSSPSVTAMTRIDGGKVTQAAEAGHRPRLARSVVRALLAEPLMHSHEASAFHADAHAGNLFAMPDGRLAILDWSLVGHLGKSERECLVQLILAALLYNAPAACRAIEQLCLRPPQPPALRAAVDAALARLNLGALPTPTWIVRLLDEIVSAGGRFSGDLLLFRKTLLTVEGVASDVDPRCRVDDVLIAAAADAFARELPWRAFAAPTSRQFASHLSNLDLWAALASAPLGMMNRWMAVGRRSD